MEMRIHPCENCQTPCENWLKEHFFAYMVLGNILRCALYSYNLGKYLTLLFPII